METELSENVINFTTDFTAIATKINLKRQCNSGIIRTLQFFDGGNAMGKHKNQADRVLQYIRDFGSITPLEAVSDLGCYRLSARIFDLRRAGYVIGSEEITVKNRYGQRCTVARYTERPVEDV